MEVLNVIQPTYSENNKPIFAENQQFEKLWKNAISGEEFERRACEHLRKLYALRETQQADN